MKIIKITKIIAIGFFSIQLVSPSYADTVKQAVLRAYKGTNPALHLVPSCALGNREITSSKGLAWLGRDKLKGQATSLNLTGNKLNDLEGIEEWISLQRLVVSYNKLVLFPESCGALTELEELDLTGNVLTGLPETLFGCTKLRTLKLGRNLLGEVPPVVLALSIEFLDISNNGIRELPDLSSMRNLKTLILCDGTDRDTSNAITHLPESLESMALQLTCICIGRLSLDEASKTMLKRMQEKNDALVVHKGVLTEDTFKKPTKAHFTGGRPVGGGACC